MRRMVLEFVDEVVKEIEVEDEKEFRRVIMSIRGW